jgi:hypothetical protein
VSKDYAADRDAVDPRQGRSGDVDASSDAAEEEEEDESVNALTAVFGQMGVEEKRVCEMCQEECVFFSCSIFFSSLPPSLPLPLPFTLTFPTFPPLTPPCLSFPLSF